jgi:hypothetical protein
MISSFFSEASLISTKIIKSALLEFESLSSLKSNPTKSSFFCSGISEIFILPKRVIKNIEQKFNRFLWNENIAGGAKAKVSWTDICLPKKEGGLGLKRLDI